MGDNDLLKNTFADLIDDLDYKITFDDIDSKSKNTIGIYLREAGKPIGILEDSNKIFRVDMTLRIHGDTVVGSQKKCEKTLIDITERLTMYNKEFTGISILGSTLRGRGVRLGMTSEKIPVYNISFLITFN